MGGSASFIPRPVSVREAEQAFCEACRDRHETLNAFIDQDIRGLDAIAGVLGAAVRQVAAVFGRLDMARSRHDSQGLARPNEPFNAETVDGYALVEALFWDWLTAEAEQLLKVQLAAELAR